MSLTKKLVLAFLLVTMVPLGAIIGLLHYTFVKHAEEQVGTRLEGSVSQAGKSVDEFMFSCIRGIKDLAEDPELSSGDRDITHKQLTRYIHSFPYFGEVMLVDAHGTVIASSSPSEVGTSLFTRFDDTRGEFEQTLHRSPGVVYISDLNEIPEPLRRVVAEGKLRDVNLGIQMLTAVQDAAGHTVSVLVADIVTAPLRDLLEDLKRHAPGDGSACLLDKGGLVLMTTEPQAPLLSPHPDVTGGALRAPLGQNASGYLVYGDAHERQQMAGYNRLRAYGANDAGNWRLITLASYDAILAPVTQSFNRTLGILFATLVGAMGLGLWLARRLADPVLKLTENAKTIAAGRFDARVAVTTHDEIGALAEAFNLMAGTVQMEITKRTQAQELLHSANDELEQRVQERTAQLTAEIGERKRAEKELNQLHRKHELVLNAVGEGIHALDLEGRITFENPAAEKMLGWETGELIGKPAHATIHHSKLGGAPYPQCECPIYASLGDGIPCRIRDEVFWRKDGTSFPVQYVITPVHDENREIIGAVVVFSDITEIKRVEQELHDAKDVAETANRAKSEFLANMSHEIRTPMNGVIGMSGLLLDTKLDPEQNEFAQTIQSSADSLLLIINDILDFSKIEAGKLTFEILDFDLIETVEGTLDMLAERAQGKGIELAGTILPGTPTRLLGDPGRLRQILTNLIGNAIKFTETGEVVVRVSKERETETYAVLRFEVQDTGIGIPPEAEARLFQPFNQADGSFTRKYGGTGLGLAISKQLVAMMQGQIGVQSQSGKGSTFWFTAQLEQQASAVNAPERSFRDSFNFRALVVDDNATNREILRRQILAWRMQANSAASGAEALKLLRAAAKEGKPYDLALLDVQMPEMDGLTLARAIKADPALAGTLLIVLSSLGHAISAAELKKIGIDAYLVKPTKQSHLFDCLVNAMVKTMPENDFAKSAITASASICLEPNPQLEKVRILLAEDNIVNQKVALGQLQKLRYKADAVANGLEVLEALLKISYDIILMDCQMPEMDGYEATRAIRKREKSSNQYCSWKSPVYIIALTAHAMEGESEKCFAVGMDDYLSKPVRTSELQTALERWKRAQNQLNRATISGDG